MTIYIVTCIFTLLLGNLAQNRNEIHVEKIVNNNSIIANGLLLILWSCVYAFRGLNVGADTYAYYRLYYLIPQLSENLYSYIFSSRDIGFTLIRYICYIFSGGSWLVYQFILGIITYLPIIYVINKYSDDVPFSLLLYIFTLSFFCGFNGTRQTIAVNIIALGYYEAFLKQNWKKVFIILIIAFLFHSTVILVIPFLYLSKFHINSKQIKIAILILIFSFIFLWDLWSYIIAFLDNVGQEKLAADYGNIDASSRGSSLLRAIVVFSPVVLAHFYQKKLFEENIESEKEMILIIFAGLFSLLSMKFWIFSRIALYFNIMTVMFVPRLLKNYSDKYQKLRKIIIGLAYFLYMIALLLHGDGHYYPYYFWWDKF